MEFFIGDLHLDHGNIIRYCNRPFRSVSGMNRTIIKRWNQTVGKHDTVLFLGDLVFVRRGWREKREVWAERAGKTASHWLRQLNGNIIFIRGNHDRYDSLPFHDSLVLERGGKRLLLIHDPMDAPVEWDGWIIHGHVHNNRPEYPLVNREKRTVNVSVELIDYTPISLEKMLRLIKK